MLGLILTIALRVTNKMNNHVNIFRVEHKTLRYSDLAEHVGIGPYRFFNNRDNDPGIPPEALSELRSRLEKNEPRMLRFNTKKVLEKKTLPSSFSWVRPGMYEDPLLREHCLRTYTDEKNYPIKLVHLYRDPIIFVFDSMTQLKRWFFDEIEFNLLEQSGFHVVKRRVKK
jgi:hypothetical protein